MCETKTTTKKEFARLPTSVTPQKVSYLVAPCVPCLSLLRPMPIAMLTRLWLHF